MARRRREKKAAGPTTARLIVEKLPRARHRASAARSAYMWNSSLVTNIRILGFNPAGLAAA